MKRKLLVLMPAAIAIAAVILTLLWQRSGVEALPPGAMGRTHSDALPFGSGSDGVSTLPERVAVEAATLVGRDRAMDRHLRIVDEGLIPIAGAQIHQDPAVLGWRIAFDAGLVVSSLEAPVATSGADGAVHLDAAGGGRSFLVTARGFLPLWFEGGILDYAGVGSLIEMQKGGRLTLRVEDQDGSPVERFWVFMESQAIAPCPSTAPRESFVHILTAQGLQVAELDCLPARAPVELLVVSPGHLPKRVEVSSRMMVATVVLGAAVSISGYVKGGAGLEGLLVRALASSGDAESNRWLEASVDGRQQFVIGGALKGSVYGLRLMMRRGSGGVVPAGSVVHVRGGDAGVELSADEELVILVRVVDADTGAQVDGVRLRATSLSDPDRAALGDVPERRATGELCMRAVTNPSGGGAFQIVATAPGYRASSTVVDPLGSRPIVAGIVAMKKVDTLSVKVASRNGQPVGGARVLLFSSDVAAAQAIGNYLGAISGADGKVALEHVALPATVAVSASGYQSRRMALSEFPRDLQVDLDLAGSVVVRGEDPAGAVVRGVAFEYRTSGGTWREGWLNGSGRCVLKNLALGEYEFRAAHGRWVRSTGPVEWSAVLPGAPLADEVRATITGDEQVVVVRCAPLTAVNIRVSGRDGPLQGSEVLLVPGDHGNVATECWLATSVLRRRADDLGVVRFGRLPEGDSTLVCLQPGVLGGGREVISVHAPQEMYQVRFEVTAVAGRIVDNMGTAIASAAIYLEETEVRWVGPPAYAWVDGHGMPSIRNGAEPKLVGRSGADGRFAFMVAGPGNVYRIAVEAPGHMRASEVLKTGAPVNITLEGAGDLRVEVPGELLPCMIEAKPVSIQAEVRKLSVPSEGVLVLSGLKPGTWSVTRYTELGSQGASVEVVVPSKGGATVKVVR